MSGVASIGSLVKLQMPTPTSTSVNASISQRCAMEKRMMLSSTPGFSAVMRSPRLFDVGLYQVALLDDDPRALVQARQDLHALAIALAQFHRPHLIGVADAYEHDVPVAEGLHRRQRHHQVDRL